MSDNKCAAERNQINAAEGAETANNELENVKVENGRPGAVKAVETANTGLENVKAENGQPGAVKAAETADTGLENVKTENGQPGAVKAAETADTGLENVTEENEGITKEEAVLLNKYNVALLEERFCQLGITLSQRQKVQFLKYYEYLVEKTK